MSSKVYRSADASAPVMCGQYGKTVQLLDAILVNGYGAKASLGWSIAYTGYSYTGTATGGANNKLIDTTRNFVADGVTVGMCVKRTADGLYGGITSISTTTNTNDTLNFTNTTNTPTFGAGDGYSIDSNKRVYRAPAGNRYYLRVDDSVSTGYARARGWEVKVDVNDVVDASNTGPFCTDAQISGGLYVYKSDAASAASRTWRCAGNDKIFYLFMRSYADLDSQYMGNLIFGDFISYKTSDVYNTVIFSHSGSSYSNNQFGYFAADPAGSYKVRSYTGTGGSVVNRPMPLVSLYASYLFGGGLAYPDAVSGALILTPIVNVQSGYCGHWPGLWCPLHAMTAFSDLDTFSGLAGPLSGKTFEVWKFPYGTNPMPIVVETSDTWS